jgi:histidyl-tRNA synthetase
LENLIKAIRGMNDILPSETILWQHAEKIMREVLQSFGFQEIRLPILEKTELFQRTIGEVTDIVEKEMYTFLDRNNESLTLRPEGTAGCVRAGIEHGLFYNQIQRLWYTGPCFRYERPQKGRYRQFFHLGAEVFGIESPDIDAELIQTAAKIYEKLGLRSHIQLQINTIGSKESRARYRQHLVDYFTQYFDLLDEDSRRRLHTNPLRILDSKNSIMQNIIENAPKILDYLDPESEKHFEHLKDYLNHLKIEFTVNPRLVRGLDYYTKTVFEWVTTELGAQGTVCGGGRYDGLIEQLGGKPTPALGYAIGLERTILLLQQTMKNSYYPHIYFIVDGENALKTGMALSNTLRDEIPHLRLMMHCGGGNIKNQFKKADKSGALVALILGEQELNNQSVAIKFLREDKPQICIAQHQLLEYLKTSLKI